MTGSFKRPIEQDAAAVRGEPGCVVFKLQGLNGPQQYQRQSKTWTFRRISLLAHKRIYQATRLHFECIAKFDELNDVEAAPSAFDLR